MENRKAFLGEFIGTYMLVIFGCGTVAVGTLFNQYQSIFQIAAMWGIAVTLGIYAARKLCCAHFNPAVSIAMAVTGRMDARQLPVYLAAQFIGAFIGGLTLYLTFHTNIAAFETVHHIIRGTQASRLSAKMFGEYYYISGTQTVHMPLAMFAEGMGTFILVFMIFALTEGCNTGKPSNNASPFFIGASLSSAICLFAPLTQAGFNPARDFAPRMVALMFGWGKAAFPDNCGGFFFVYMLAPVIGGVLAGLLFTHLVEKNMNDEPKCSTCDTTSCKR